MFKTIAEIKKANQALGHHWFDRSSMEFFNSRVEGGPYAGGYFFSSEAEPGEDRERRFTIRHAADDGSIDTVGEFMGYDTYEEARAGLRALLSPNYAKKVQS